MQDAVKIIAEGIRVDKKLLKPSAKGKRQSRRSITADRTNIEKNDESIIVNATSNENSNNQPNDLSDKENDLIDKENELNDKDNESSANRTDEEE